MSNADRVDHSGSIDVSRIRKLAAAATPGPWTARVYLMGWEVLRDVAPRDRQIATGASREDAAYVAAVDPSVVLRIIETLEEVARQRDALREAICDIPPRLDELPRVVAVAAPDGLAGDDSEAT